MPRSIREVRALSLVLLALGWSVFAPVAMASGAVNAAPQAAAGWPKCQGTTLTYCYTSNCRADGHMVFNYWVVWQTILDHHVDNGPNSCSNA